MELTIPTEQFGYLAASAPLVVFAVSGALAWGVAIWNGWTS